MKVHLNQIRANGLHLEGEEKSDILELDDPSIRPLSPIHYSLDADIAESSFFVTGRLDLELELECVTCLERFHYPLQVSRFAFQTEAAGGETIDLTPSIREDILLVLPSYPHCDWNGERVCKGARKIKNETQGSEAGAWDALDKLKTGKNYGSTQT